MIPKNMIDRSAEWLKCFLDFIEKKKSFCLVRRGPHIFQVAQLDDEVQMRWVECFDGFPKLQDGILIVAIYRGFLLRIVQVGD